MEAERVEAERVEAERVEAEESTRVEAQRIEAERVEAERFEAERVEAERVEAEEASRIEAERVEAEAKANAEIFVAEQLEEEERKKFVPATFFNPEWSMDEVIAWLMNEGCVTDILDLVRGNDLDAENLLELTKKDLDAELPGLSSDQVEILFQKMQYQQGPVESISPSKSKGAAFARVPTKFVPVALFQSSWDAEDTAEWLVNEDFDDAIIDMVLDNELDAELMLEMTVEDFEVHLEDAVSSEEITTLLQKIAYTGPVASRATPLPLPQSVAVSPGAADSVYWEVDGRFNLGWTAEDTIVWLKREGVADEVITLVQENELTGEDLYEFIHADDDEDAEESELSAETMKMMKEKLSDVRNVNDYVDEDDDVLYDNKRVGATGWGSDEISLWFAYLGVDDELAEALTDEPDLTVRTLLEFEKETYVEMGFSEEQANLVVQRLSVLGKLPFDAAFTSDELVLWLFESGYTDCIEYVESEQLDGEDLMHMTDIELDECFGKDTGYNLRFEFAHANDE